MNFVVVVADSIDERGLRLLEEHEDIEVVSMV